MRLIYTNCRSPDFKSPIGPTKNLERHYNRVVVWLALLQFVLLSHFISQFLSPIPFYPLSQFLSFSYMSLPCYSPSFNCPLFLSLICLQCLPNFVIPYFLSLEFHSPNFSPRFLSLNSSSPSLPPKCLFLNFLSHEFHFHNFSPRNLFLSDDDFMFIPHQDQ